MQSDRRKLGALMFFHFAWAFVLWLSISKYGLGVSTDSVEYMFTGQNLAQGNGLISYDNSAYYYWPPLYPLLIAFLNIFGVSIFAAAHIIQFAGFALIAYFSSRLFLKIFDFPFAFIAAFLLDTSAVVVSSFHMVGTDYLFLLFPILLTLLSARYAEDQKWTTLILIGLTISLAMLLRYIGYTLVLAGLWSAYRYTNGSPLKRILRAVSVGLFSIPPFLWVLYTWISTTGNRRGPLSLFEYTQQLTSGIMDWFTSNPPNDPDVTVSQILLVWVPILVLIAWSLGIRKIDTPLTSPLLLHGLLYITFILINASIVYFNRLNGRFLLPMYLPLVILLLLLMQQARKPVQGIITVFLLLLLPLQLNRTIYAMRASVNGDIPFNAYNNHDWNENHALQFWRNHTPQGNYILLSNYQAGVAFQTGHVTIASPRRTEVYGTEVYPLSRYVDEMFDPGYGTYLIWIEPNIYKHVYEPMELSPVANIEILFKNKDGAVYHLMPAK